MIPVAAVGGLGAAAAGGSFLSTLAPLAGPISSLLGGLGSKGSSRSSSSSSSLANVAVNPSIAVVNGGGFASPSASGYASGSPSSSANSSGNESYPSYLPTTGSYGPVNTTRPGQYGMIDAAPRPLASAAGIFDDPMVLLIAGGIAIALAMSAK